MVLRVLVLRKIKYLIVLFSFGIFFQVSLLYPQVVNLAKPFDQVDTTSEIENADQVMKGVHLVEAREGGREWELFADQAVAFRDSDSWQLDLVRVTLFADNGVEFFVTGNQGLIGTKTKDLTITGQVVIRSTNGYQFKTTQVRYDSEVRRLESLNPVEVLGPKDPAGFRLSLRGGNLTASLVDSEVLIGKGVETERMVPPGRILKIRSQGARLSGIKKVAEFLGDVVMDMNDTRITGPRAEFEYDPKGERIKSIVIKGGARVSDHEKWATSDHLSVFFDDEKYVLRGNPRVVQDSDELRGEEIVFLEGGKKVQVQRARAKVDELKLDKGNTK